MPELTLQLQATDHAAVVAAGAADGVSPEAWAARAVQRALASRRHAAAEHAERAEDVDALSPGRSD